MEYIGEIISFIIGVIGTISIQKLVINVSKNKVNIKSNNNVIGVNVGNITQKNVNGNNNVTRK